MQHMTTADAKALLAETGHQLTLDDIAPIMELDAAADAVVAGPKDKTESIYAYPLLYGGEAFFPPSIGKQIYWQEKVAESLPEDWLTCAYLWLLSRPDVPVVKEQKPYAKGPFQRFLDWLFSRPENPPGFDGDVLKSVKTWARRCRLDADDVARIIEAYNTGETTDTGKARYGEIISLLVREYGKDCDHWLNAPEHEISMLLGDWTRRQEARAAEYRRSKVGGKNPLPPLPSPKIQALKRYRELKTALREKWLKSA